MLKKLIRISNNHFGAVALTLIVVLIAFLNYHPNTWLTGWDNLHPELNFHLNIKRTIFSAWQEYQGLGLLGGMGHASDLPRQLFLWLVSFILPTHFIRYFFHFLMLLTGVLGIYFLLKKIILVPFDRSQKEIASFIGGVFYLFNLATLQMFYVPFEPYSAHFAFLPWLFLVNLNFLNKGDKRSLILLFLVNILAIPQGYVATYFLVYFIFLSIVFLFYFLLKRQSLRKILVAYLILFCLNAFWLLPNLYFAFTSTDINVSAMINQMSTENNILLNKKYGDLTNATILKGFWFENIETDQEGNLGFQMGNWVDHLKNPLVLSIGYLLFVLSLSGIFFVIKKKIIGAMFFIPVALFGFTFLANDAPLFSQISSLFYKVPLFFQIFRFPYTKFAIITAFCLSIFYALAFFSITALTKKSLLKKAILIVFILLPIVFLYPVFQGDFLHSKNRIEIPSEYFQVFDFFKKHGPNTRIANFPQHTFWGWFFYRWDYRGSGFLWYGIEQPIIDRAFDPWSNKNENYYWEIAYAVYSQNRELFERILEKYQISWLLLDRNIINPASPKAIYLDELEEMIANSEKIILTQEFGKVKIYQFKLETPVNNFVFLAQNLPVVGPEYYWNNYDFAYFENGNYITSPTTNNSQPATQIYYPFRSLFTGRSQENLEFSIEDRGDHFLFLREVPDLFRHTQLLIPREGGKLSWIDPKKLGQVRLLKTDVYLAGQKIRAVVPKVEGLFSAKIDPADELKAHTPENCNVFTQGKVANEIIEENSKKLLRLTAIDGKNCSPAFWLPNLPHNQAYLITIESRHLKGKSLLLWLENPNARKADIETYLPKNSELGVAYFIQPAMESDGLGYAIHIDNISIGNEESINDLGRITVSPLPFEFLTKIKLVNEQITNNNPKLASPLRAIHPNPSFYRVERESISDQILVLSQAFHSGWQAYKVNGRTPSILTPLLSNKIENHLMINNWENGWLVNNEERIEIIFLPQYLEYFGFLIFFLFGCFTLIFLVKS